MKRRMAAIGLVAAALIGAFGCGRSSPTEPAVVRVTTLAVGQRVTIATGLVLSFHRVVSDSRCPVEVTCVWEGEVTLGLTLSGATGEEAFTLSDHAPKRVVSGHSFTLLAVDPLPRLSAIPEDAYRATIQVD
ncbi:MAG: hypothetical protein NEA02_11495 [Thermoanaerobaculia bacterium]|nr:hypothetical protein [Thermoanaerobaculia bacterium]